MDDEFERRVWELFERVFDLTPDARRAVLDAAGESNPGVADKARRLLDADLARTNADDDAEIGVSSFLQHAFQAALQATSDEWSAPDLRAALVGDRFVLGQLIGTGRFGAVYEANDQLTGQRVAVKLLFGPEEVRSVTGPRERIALLALDVPGVVRLLSSGTYEGRPYLVTEFFDGQPFPGASLPVPWQSLVGIAIALLETLNRMHAAGVIHGDLKPDNILVGDDGRLRVVDFGVSVGEAVAYTGSLFDAWGGTLPYLAPELCRKGATGPTVHSDLFAVGILIFEALSGGVPHATSDRDAFVERRVTEPVDMGALRRVDLPASARRAIASLLETDPTLRPSTAADALAALRGSLPPVEAINSRVATLLTVSPVDDPDDLRPLFAGPDRLLHIPTDAALLLWRRTSGHVPAIADELSRWVRNGFAQMDDGSLRLARDDLARLEALPPAAGPELESLDKLTAADAAPMLDLIVAAGMHARLGALAAASGVARGKAQAHLDRLCDNGLAEARSDGVYRALYTAPGWSATERRRAVHDALAEALPTGEEGRLVHLVEAQRFSEVAEDVVACSARKIGNGDVTGAREVVTRGLAILRAAGRPQDEEALLVRELLEAAISEGTESALRLVLYEVERSSNAGVSLGGVGLLARAALRCVRGDGVGGLALANSIRINVKDVLLELRRQSVRVFATQFLDGDAAIAIVNSACDWSERHGDDVRVRAETLSWQADAAIRAGDYDAAVDINREALRGAASHRARIIALLSSSAAALEANRLDIARDGALQARDRARATRHAAFEARAETRLRAALYRAGDAGPVDDELVEAILVLPDLLTRGAALLTEAAVAWRRDEFARARELASECARQWEQIGVRDAVDLAQSLADVCDDGAAIERDDALLERVARYPRPGVSAQILGLQGLLQGGLPAASQATLRSLIERLPEPALDRRREVLTLDECLRFAGC